MTSIFVANTNVDVQNNLNYMKNDFVNREENDREDDREDRKNIDVDQMFKVCYNCDSFEHLFNTCIKSHVFNFVSTN